MSGGDEPEVRRRTAAALAAWEVKAPWWDAHFGESPNRAVWPTVEGLLALAPGERVLEVACGNGAFARHLASRGATVLATDFSPAFLRLAQGRGGAPGGAPGGGAVDFRQVDATDPAQLAALGGPQGGTEGGPFDAAVCIMGLMDIATIDPLMQALARLLRPGGRFVFTVTHPCFNHTGAARVVEEHDREGELVTTRAVKVTDYLTERMATGVAVIGEPAPHPYFERPLQGLLEPAFRAGFALDGLQELAAEPPAPGEVARATSWRHFTEIPLFLAARLRLPALSG